MLISLMLGSEKASSWIGLQFYNIHTSFMEICKFVHRLKVGNTDFIKTMFLRKQSRLKVSIFTRTKNMRIGKSTKFKYNKPGSKKAFHLVNSR
jgi:hypothetical protein